MREFAMKGTDHPTESDDFVFAFYNSSSWLYPFSIHSSGGISMGSTYYSTNPGLNNVIIEGRLGIGTSIPLYQEHIVNKTVGINTIAYLEYANAVSSGGAIAFGGNSLVYSKIESVIDAGGEVSLRFYDFQGAILTEVMRIDGGNFGVGVQDPDTKTEILHAGTQLKLSYDATNFITLAVQTDGDLTIDSNKTSYDFDLGDGNILISGLLDGVDLSAFYTAYGLHRHDTQTLEHDAVNSDGGAFAFNTTGTVTFNNDVTATGVLTSSDATYPPARFWTRSDGDILDISFNASHTVIGDTWAQDDNTKGSWIWEWAGSGAATADYMQWTYGDAGYVGAGREIMRVGPTNSYMNIWNDAYDTMVGQYIFGQDRFHIWLGDAGADPTWLHEDAWLLESDSWTHMQCFSPTGGSIQWSKAGVSGRARGYIAYVHATDYMSIGVANDEKIRILATGYTGFNELVPRVQVEIGGKLQLQDILVFNDTESEFVGSLDAGYVDYGATTGHRFNNTVDVDSNLITNVADAVNLTDAVNLNILLDHIGVALNYWLGSTTLDLALTDAEASYTETPNAEPDELSNIYFKSSVAETPAPFLIKAGTIIEIHWTGDETSGGGRNVGLYFQLGYVNANGTTDFVQIGANSDTSDALTNVKTAFSSHIHVASDTTVPAGKRLWLKVFSITVSGAGGYPTIRVYYDNSAYHMSLEVAGSVLGSFVKADGSTVYTATGAGFKDEDNMASDSAVATASQQSIKKYVDDNSGGDVTAGANIDANAVVIGDDGAKGVKKSTLLVSDNGEMTNPSQPAFLARPAGAQANIAINTVVTVLFGTEIFDQGNDFAANTFTAPVDGRYQLNTLILLENTIDSACAFYYINIVTSNRTYYTYFAPNRWTADIQYWSFPMGVLADMDAGDTAYVVIWQNAGTQQTDISAQVWFSGALIC